MTTEYRPLYVGGKRDSARRYVAPDGAIISRREQIKRTEGRSPEQKAVDRYHEGKAPRGKTVDKVKKQEVKKYGRPEKPEKYRRPAGEPTHVREMNTDRGAYQLTGRYKFRNAKFRMFAKATGYSTVSRRQKTGADFDILRTQAVNSAQATLPHSGWVVIGIEYEHWLHW